MSGSSTPQAIPTFANLPVEIVKEICTHLQVAHKCRKEQRDLSSLSLTCRRVYECARTLLWRNLHVTFDQIQPRDDHVLRMLQDIISSLNHPLFLSLNRLHVIMPYYSITTRDSFAKELDKTLGTLIAGAEVLQEIHVDLGIVDAPELHFYNLLDSVLRHESVTSISLLGYAGELPFRAQARPMISHLTLGQIGGSLALDLRSFNSLRRLHLCTDCWDETLSDSNHWQVPPQLWVTLDTFVLEIYGWQPHAEMVMQTVAESVKTAGYTNLRKLGIFLNLDGCTAKTLLDTFIRVSPNIDCLALVLPELPRAVDIEKLAMLCPGLRELTLCAYLLSGTWKWPETSHNYAAAFSNFRQLRRLALNHDDLAVELNDFGEMESFGKFSTACSEEGTDLRHAFCRSLAQSCSSLTEIAFCPIEQDQSRLLIERKGEILAEVRFTDNGGHFFWRPS